MQAKVIRIGNSRGIRIPKAVLEECGIKDSVELNIDDGAITLRAAAPPRAGWAEAALEMSAASDDRLIEPSAPTTFDQSEWEW